MNVELKRSMTALASFVLIGVAPSVSAHTTIVAKITSGDLGFGNISINHGCLQHSPALPVVAESVVFPTINPKITRSDTKATTTLGEHFGISTGDADDPDAPIIPLNTLANLPKLIQSRDIFNAQIQQFDSLDRVIGWVSTRGNLGISLIGHVPFQVGPVSFSGAGSCASQLRIQVAVADICDIREKPPFVSNRDNAGVNLWIDNQTPGLADIGFTPGYIEDGAATPLVVINRDTEVNPYPSNCVPAGGDSATFSVDVFPSAADIARLQFPGWGTPAPDSTFK